MNNTNIEHTTDNVLINTSELDKLLHDDVNEMEHDSELIRLINDELESGLEMQDIAVNQIEFIEPCEWGGSEKMLDEFMEKNQALIRFTQDNLLHGDSVEAPLYIAQGLFSNDSQYMARGEIVPDEAKDKLFNVMATDDEIPDVEFFDLGGLPHAKLYHQYRYSRAQIHEWIKSQSYVYPRIGKRFRIHWLGDKIRKLHSLLFECEMGAYPDISRGIEYDARSYAVPRKYFKSCMMITRPEADMLLWTEFKLGTNQGELRSWKKSYKAFYNGNKDLLGISITGSVNIMAELGDNWAERGATVWSNVCGPNDLIDEHLQIKKKNKRSARMESRTYHNIGNLMRMRLAMNNNILTLKLNSS